MIRCLYLIAILVFSAHTAFADDAPAVIELSLKKALARSQEIGLNVIVANSRLQQSLSQLSQAQSSLLPQVSATLNGQRQSRDLRMSGIDIPNMPPYTGPFNTFDARAHITQTLFDGGTFERLKAARLTQKLSSNQLAKAKDDTAAFIAILYIQAKRATQEVKALRMFVKRDRMAYDIIKTEYHEGTKSLVDLKKAKADFYNSSYMFRNARAEAKERSLNLAAALQLDPKLPISFDLYEDLNLLQQADLKDAPQLWDVTVAENQLTVAEANLAESRADNLPRISLIGDYGRSGESPSEGSNTYTLGLMATVPIWQGGSQQAKTKEAKARVDEAKAVLADAQAQSNATVMNAKENISKAKALIKAQGAALELAREQLKVMKEQYASGTAQDMDVMRARAQNIYALDQYKESLAVLWTAYINLAKAQGQIHNIL